MAGKWCLSQVGVDRMINGVPLLIASTEVLKSVNLSFVTFLLSIVVTSFFSFLSFHRIVLVCDLIMPGVKRERSPSASSSASQNSSSSSSGHRSDEEAVAAASVLSSASLTTPRLSRQRTRLVIREIEVENFKSYYGKHVIGPFHKTFTAVIGPNGSGKSNVIDSMLFVFGRKAKQIRLEKLSELIHNSAAHPDVRFASVTVNFVRLLESEEDEKRRDQRVEVENSLLSIRREVFRSGTSQYYINQTRSSQKEVERRLIDEGIDLEHNRFLILQGEVEQISLMKPKGEKEGEEGLLEYLDDLIGTNRMLEPIQKLAEEVEVAQAARLEALAKQKKMLLEREALDDAKNTAIDFVVKENQQKRTLVVMCQLRMRSTEESLAEPRRVLAEIDERVAAHERELEAHKKERAKAEEASHAAKKEVTESTTMRDGVRKQRQTVVTRLEKLKAGAAEHDRSKAVVEEKLQKAIRDAQAASVQQQDAEREAAIHESQMAAARAAATELEVEHDCLAAQLLPKLKPLRQELDQRRHLMAPFEEAVAAAEEEARSVKERLVANEAAQASSEARLQEVAAENSRDADRMEELERQLKGAEEAQSLQGRQRELGEALTEATRKKYAINAAIQERKMSVREGEADDKAVGFLLSQRSLKGYFGTLRQLGRIDDRYDIAAGVASNAWGFHVVEDRPTATAALTLLKQEKIGRASVMVVQEVQREMKQRMEAPFTSPSPKAQRLFDLIEPRNEKFRVAFYQAVRDTLVVSSLSEAREVAFHSTQGKRYRVVTLKGEVVEPSGFITGGGAVPRGAKLKAAHSPVDRQALLEELRIQQSELQQAVEEERALQLRLQECSEAAASGMAMSPANQKAVHAELRRLRARQESFAARREAVLMDVKEAQATCASKQASLQRSLTEVEAAVTAAKERREVECASLVELERQIEEAGGTTFQGLTARLKAEQERVAVEESALRTCRRQQQKFSAAQKRCAVDTEEYRNRLAQLELEAAEGVKEKVSQCTQSLEELSRQLQHAETSLAEALQAAEQARAVVPRLHQLLLQAQNKLDDESRYRQSEAAKMAAAVQQLSKYEQKIEGCEETIKNNVEMYGLETLQLDPPEETQQVESSQGSGNTKKKVKLEQNRNSSSDDDDEDDDGEVSHNEAEETDDGRGGKKKTGFTLEEVKQMSFKLSPAELAACDYNRCRHLATALLEELERLRGDIDFRAVSLWWERDTAHRQAMAAYLECKQQSDELDQRYYEMKQQRKKAFMEVFVTVQVKIKEVYQLLTHGGDADLELVDVNDPFEGVNYVVRPPRKPWRQISFLSGGEKTLSSLALIFSLHHVKPTPVYVMDEIDAALDFRNVTIVANYVVGMTTGAQFIIISLRNNMFELAHQLVGVCKVNDITNTLVLLPHLFQAKVREECRARLLQASSPSKDRKRQRSNGEEADKEPDSAQRGSTASRKSIRFAEEIPPTPVDGDSESAVTEEPREV